MRWSLKPINPVNKILNRSVIKDKTSKNLFGFNKDGGFKKGTMGWHRETNTPIDTEEYLSPAEHYKVINEIFIEMQRKHPELNPDDEYGDREKLRILTNKELQRRNRETLEYNKTH